MMNKKTSMQDIKPAHRRSIRDIPLGHEELATETKSRKKKIKQPEPEEFFVESSETILNLEDDGGFNVDYLDKESRPLSWVKITMWVVLIGLIIGGGFFASSFFNSAVVEVNAKEVTSKIDSEIKLSKNAAQGTLPFETVNLAREVSQTIPAQGEKSVQEKATGRVVVYNKNLTSQKLLSQTRLESPSGKVYRTVATIVVPAGKKSGSTVNPGSIEVNVVADTFGSEYNSDLTDFTLPGFKGSPKFQAVYARSKTIISGGALGTIKVADPKEAAQAEKQLRDSLKDQLITSVNQQKPETFVLLGDLYSINFASSTQETKDDMVVVKQKADFVGVLVNSQKFSSFLAAQLIHGYSNEDIQITNLKDLSFTPTSATSTLSSDISQFSVKVSGKPHFVYMYDQEKLKSDLAGMSRDSFPTVLATYVGIEKGNAEIKPFWRNHFPSDVNKISINQ
ncbi:MAG: hypothetical protein WCO12_00295 [bacterium]